MAPCQDGNVFIYLYRDLFNAIGCVPLHRTLSKTVEVLSSLFRTRLDHCSGGDDVVCGNDVEAYICVL